MGPPSRTLRPTDERTLASHQIQGYARHVTSEPAQLSWIRRHSGPVVSTVVAAVLAGAISLGYWYFGQRPLENRDQKEVSKQAEVRQLREEKQAELRRLYEDSRRLVVSSRAELRRNRSELGPAAYTHWRTFLSRAISAHNEAYQLMQDGRYAAAVAGFKKAQKLLQACRGCEPILP